jgi:uncharacterized protein
MLDEKFVESMPKLGFGLMRLPRKDVENDIIDVEQTAEMADKFLDAGLKYFDTAYVYNGSEEAARKAITSRHPRDSYYITSKLYVNAAKTIDEAKNQINVSLEREGVDYIDFYLLHAINDDSIQKYDAWNLWDYVKELKEEGKIKHYGFSFHGTAKVLDKILSEHEDVDFVQLQINYADWNNPSVDSKGVYEVARKHNKPIVVMEPIKGGTLANPPKPVADLLKKADPNASLASWAVRFVASLPGIMVVLSGMSNVEQMEDNLSYMSDFKPLSEEEKKVIEEAMNILQSIEQVPCTACHYCTEGCPMKIQIPDIFKAMNLELIYNDTPGAKKRYENATMEPHGKASACVKCGQCEVQCPQHIHIREWLDKVAQTLE